MGQRYYAMCSHIATSLTTLVSTEQFFGAEVRGEGGRDGEMTIVGISLTCACTHTVWIIPPVSSNSELLTVPCGIVQLTRDSTTSFGKGALHNTMRSSVGFGDGCSALGCG